MVKRRWAVFACLWLVGVLLAWGAENVPLEAPGAIVMGLTAAIAVTRFGLLATAAFTAASLLLVNFPLVLSSGWYAPYALIATGLLVRRRRLGVPRLAGRAAGVRGEPGGLRATGGQGPSRSRTGPLAVTTSAS